MLGIRIIVFIQHFEPGVFDQEGKQGVPTLITRRITDAKKTYYLCQNNYFASF